MSQHQDNYYLKAVTNLGDSTVIVASQDIYSTNGTKLVAAGFHINSKLYDRLSNHILKPALDSRLSSEATLQPNQILENMHELLNKNPKLKLMVEAINKQLDFDQVIKSLQLPAPLLFKLTVSKSEFSAIYHRALTCLIITLFISLNDQLKKSEVKSLALAALLHNIGMMHINPQLLQPDYIMNHVERRHLYAHPMMAFLMLKELKALPIEASQAILEQYERMDGRGYPRGVKGIYISRLGQILGLAVVSSRSLEAYETPGEFKKLETMLKVNAKQYGNNLIGTLLNFMKKTAAYTQHEITKLEEIRTNIMVIAKAVQVLDQIKPKDISELTKFATSRFASLRIDFLSTGIDLNDLSQLNMNIEDEPNAIAEYVPLIKEAKWQMNSIITDISRLWNKEVEDAYLPDSNGLSWYKEIKHYLNLPV